VGQRHSKDTERAAGYILDSDAAEATSGSAVHTRARGRGQRGQRDCTRQHVTIALACDVAVAGGSSRLREGTTVWKAEDVVLPAVLLLVNTAGWPTIVGTRGALLKKIWPFTMVTGVACCGSVMLHTICKEPPTDTAPQYCPVSLDLSSTGVFSVTASLAFAALVTVKVVAGLGLGLGLPGGDGGGALMVVNTPLTTASVPVVEVKLVEVLGAMYRGGGGGDGGGGPGDGGGGLGAG
jgi:hypothetical protein